MSIVYLNGAYLPLEDARISVLDRGFTFGDGVYEVIPVFSGRMLRLEEHLQRLQNNLTSIYIENPYTVKQWSDLLDELLIRNHSDKDQSIYIQVTRGVGERDHYFEPNLKPTVFATCKTIIEKDFSSGISAVTHPDIRWQYCNIKAITLLPGVLLKHYARNKDGSTEAILIRDGSVTEGAASNVFIVNDQVVKTPEKTGHLLPGITRDLVVELLLNAGIPCEETVISETGLKQADEIWITSSTMGIAPVTQLDGKPVGSGRPGKVWGIANKLYQDFKNNR